MLKVSSDAKVSQDVSFINFLNTDYFPIVSETMQRNITLLKPAVSVDFDHADEETVSQRRKLLARGNVIDAEEVSKSVNKRLLQKFSVAAPWMQAKMNEDEKHIMD